MSDVEYSCKAKDIKTFKQLQLNRKVEIMTRELYEEQP